LHDRPPSLKSPRPPLAPGRDAAAPIVEVVELGRVRYAEADEAMRRRHAAVVAGEAADALLLLECEPVVTVSRRPSAAAHLRLTAEQLASRGIEVASTDRGGDVTYHGPGQLVVYPVLALDRYGLNVTAYLRLLETAVIDALRAVGVRGVRDPEATGVWLDPAAWSADEGAAGPGHGGGEAGGDAEAKGEAGGDAEAKGEAGGDAGGEAGGEAGDRRRWGKVAAIGVRISRRTTLHGLALNVEPDLSHFQTIVPCGLVDRPVTSLAAATGRAFGMAAVRRAVAGALRDRLREAAASGSRAR